MTFAKLLTLDVWTRQLSILKYRSIGHIYLFMVCEKGSFPFWSKYRAWFLVECFSNKSKSQKCLKESTLAICRYSTDSASTCSFGLDHWFYLFKVKNYRNVDRKKCWKFLNRRFNRNRLHRTSIYPVWPRLLSKPSNVLIPFVIMFKSS